MIRKEAKSRFEINACNEKELSKEYCNAIFKKKFVVNTLKSYIYTVFLLVFLFCQLYFTISQNYFIFTSLRHLIEIGNSFEK
jgi:hypothetical protein